MAGKRKGDKKKKLNEKRAKWQRDFAMKRFVMKGKKKNRKMERKLLLSKRRERNELFRWEKVFEDGWLTRQIAVLSERVDV